MSELHETIRGGEGVPIRRARPEDNGPDFFQNVSAEDLRLRFLGSITEHSAMERDKLTELDYKHKIAFIALDEDTSLMLGPVRLIDEPDEKSAQFAILVRSRLKSAA